MPHIMLMDNDANLLNDPKSESYILSISKNTNAFIFRFTLPLLQLFIY